uniref:Transposase n=1 Tax=Heterorhabditis bacteriophora TaxID=37862 RepID=A0A1I7X4J8_HETBA
MGRASTLSLDERGQIKCPNIVRSRMKKCPQLTQGH